MCLSLGCCVKLNGHATSSIHEMDIDNKYDEVDNNDGISVFDVTVPSFPKYAMIQLTDYEEQYREDENEDDAVAAVDSMTSALKAGTILNASDYMLRYRNDDADHAAASQIQELDALPQVDVASLRSAWPYGSFQPRESTTNTGDDIADAASVGKKITLTESSMLAVMENAMQGDLPDIKWLTEAEPVPGFTKSLRTYIYAHPEVVHGRTASFLLGHVLKRCTLIDLHSFSLLSFEDLMTVVDIIAADGNKFSLTLPDLEDLTVSNLHRLLSNGLIDELHVGLHQAGSLGDFVNAIDGTSVTKFTTPELYSRSFAPLGDSPEAVRREIINFKRPWTAWKCSVPPLPRPRQFPISQLVFVAWPADMTPPTSTRGDSVLSWSKLLIPKNFDGISETSLLSLPLSDWFLSAGQGIKNLPTFLSHLAKPVPESFDLLLGPVVLGMLRRLALKVSA